MKSTVLFLLQIGLSFQVNSGSLTIVGDPGPELSVPEVEDISRLAGAEGGEPWLFIGVGGQLRRHQIVRVFCLPTKSSKTVRKGALVHIHRNRMERGGVWLPWRLGSRETYAQVKIQEREFDDVKDNRDFNRPFSVVGDFSDKELEQIVKFTRSSPTWTVPIIQPGQERVSVQVKGTLPIWWIHRKKDDTVEVNLIDGPSRGQTVRLRMEEGKWIITSIGNGIT